MLWQGVFDVGAVSMVDWGMDGVTKHDYTLKIIRKLAVKTAAISLIRRQLAEKKITLQTALQLLQYLR